MPGLTPTGEHVTALQFDEACAPISSAACCRASYRESRQPPAGRAGACAVAAAGREGLLVCRSHAPPEQVLRGLVCVCDELQGCEGPHVTNRCSVLARVRVRSEGDLRWR